MKILIIGAGTAGSSVAAALSNNKDLDITLIEPLDIPTIGVGESTLPIINDFHEHFDIFSDLQWLEKVNGAVKLSIDFRNFMKKKDAIWSHPFYLNPELEKIHILDNTSLDNPSLTNMLFYTQKIKNQGFQVNEKNLAKIGAYHFDAGLYAQELKKIARSKNVRILNNTITHIEQKKNITQSVLLDDGNLLTADLYIDCTGFKNILFEKLNAKFNTFTDRLFCDRAITIRLPYINEKEQKVNATLAHALDNGWVWHTALEDMIATGYVFSSKHTDAQSASLELKTYLHEKYGYDIESMQHNVVHFRSGAFEESWIGNNIAIGLSSFFIEPMEATGIALFQMQILELDRILRTNMHYAQNYRHLYNSSIRRKIYSVKDFIEMHYILSDKDTSKFWKDSRSIALSTKQKKLLKLYKNKEYEKVLSLDIEGVFGSLSWFLLLHGMRT